MVLPKFGNAVASADDGLMAALLGRLAVSTG